MFAEFSFLLLALIAVGLSVWLYTMTGQLAREKEAKEAYREEYKLERKERDKFETRLKYEFERNETLGKLCDEQVAEIEKLQSIVKSYQKADKRELTNEQVEALRCVFKSGYPVTGQFLADHLDVNASTISEIKNYKSYKEIKPMKNFDKALEILGLEED